MVCSLGPQMLSVNAELPVQSVPELIAYAKANRGKLSIAFDTTAGAAGFAAKLLNKRADLGLVEVPYRSAAQMAQDVASGVTPGADELDRRRATRSCRRARCAASRSPRRSAFPGLPDLPSLNETVPGRRDERLVRASSRPPARRPTSSRGSTARSASILKGPEIQQRLLSFGLATEGAGTPESTGQLIRDQQEEWRALAQELDIQPQ